MSIALDLRVSRAASWRGVCRLMASQGGPALWGKKSVRYVTFVPRLAKVWIVECGPRYNQSVRVVCFTAAARNPKHGVHEKAGRTPPSCRLSAADRQSKMRLGSEGTHARDGQPSGFSWQSGARREIVTWDGHPLRCVLRRVPKCRVREECRPQIPSDSRSHA